MEIYLRRRTINASKTSIGLFHEQNLTRLYISMPRKNFESEMKQDEVFQEFKVKLQRA